MDRSPHWIPENRQERMPTRMVAFDTESRFHNEGDMSVQTFRTASAIRWRTDLKSGERPEGAAFNDPVQLWEWVTEYCRKGTRTVMWAHNLGHDVRIADVFHILPRLGWRLDWCNLDRNVSVMSWRSDRGTLVLCDTWTWIPLPLNVIAPATGLVKFDMPRDQADDETWTAYCMRDTEIVYRVVSSLVRFIQRNNLGNWQPTGAGMAYATWRHKFMQHKVLVHDNELALTAERAAMHTGRAEAWRHGVLYGEIWTEVDMRNAYLMIGASCDLPRKLRSHHGSLAHREYDRIAEKYRILCRADIDTRMPVAPTRVDGRFVWPIGTYESWLWDVEIDALMRYGAQVKIKEAYVYAKDPILKEWAEWVLGLLYAEPTPDNIIAKNWIKHCSRALIGRLAMRTPTWEPFGDNPEGITGLTRMTDAESGIVHRMMHVGGQTLIESARKEGRDSLPQVTGWIMAKCREMLWEGMNIAGLDNIAHVDTDSILVNRAGLKRLQMGYGDDFIRLWHVKGAFRRLELYGPRAYFRDGRRVTAGIPLKAEHAGGDVYRGEKWTALSGDLEEREGACVTTTEATWTLRKSDPRRADNPGAATMTIPYQVFSGSLANSSERSDTADGS